MNSSSALAAVTGTQVSDCAWDYAACLMNPWNGPVACFPDNYALPNTRFRVRKNISFVTGTLSGGASYGFVMFNPFTGVTSDGVSVYTTGATFAGSAFSVSATGVVNTGAASQMANGMFQITDYNVILNQVRVVSAGIRVFYTGALQNCQGQWLAYESPDHQTLDTLDWSTVSARPGVIVTPVKAGETIAVRSSGAKNPYERDYCVDPMGAAAGNVGPYLGVICNCGTAGTPFACEISIVYEIIGKNNQNPSPV